MTQIIRSSREEFERKMLELYKTKHGYWPSNAWFEAVESAQQGLRARLGGVRRVMCINIDNAEMPASLKDIEPLYRELTTILGAAFFTSYKLTPQVFQFANATLSSPDPKIKPRKTSIGKIVSHYMDKAACFDQDRKKHVNQLLARLGVIWARARQEKYRIYVNVTTSPIAFASIGHYGPDQGSCFGQCRENHTHKLGIAKHPYSAVVLLSEEELEDGVIYHPSYLARWYMFASEIDNDKFSRVNVFNYYPRGGVVEGNVLFAMRKMAEAVLGHTDVEVVKNKFNIEGIYHNNRGGVNHLNFTYGKDLDKAESWSLRIEPHKHVSSVVCGKCGNRQFDRSDGFVHCGTLVCPYCAPLVPKPSQTTYANVPTMTFA